MAQQFEREERRWAEICEWLKALGYVESFDKGDMKGDVAKRMQKAIEKGDVVQLRRGIYRLENPTGKASSSLLGRSSKHVGGVDLDQRRTFARLREVHICQRGHRLGAQGAASNRSPRRCPVKALWLRWAYPSTTCFVVLCRRG